MNDKVLLAQLKERQSAKGTRYLSGWLGKARVVGFLDREAGDGETVWQIYVQTPEDRGDRAASGSADRSGSGGSSSGDRRGGYQHRPAQRQHQSIPDVARGGDTPF